MSNYRIKSSAEFWGNIASYIGNFHGTFTHANTADRLYTLPDKAGTVAVTTDITGGFTTTARTNFRAPYTQLTAAIDGTQAIFGINAGNTYTNISIGAYVNDAGTWTHQANGLTTSAALKLTTTAAIWYTSSNSSASWNVANGVTLWDQTGSWTAPVASTGTISGTQGTFTGLVMNGNITMDDTTTERRILGNGSYQWGMYMHSLGTGLYDWTNTRSILQYSAATNLIVIGTNGSAVTLGNSGSLVSLPAGTAYAKIEQPGATGVYKWKDAGYYSSALANKSGMIRIKSPQKFSSTMMKIKLSGNEYTGSGAWEARIGGYTYMLNGWWNFDCETTQKIPFDSVRFTNSQPSIVTDLVNIAVDSTAKTFTRSDGGSFITDGFVNGQYISCYPSANYSGYLISNVTASVITCAVTGPTVTESAALRAILVNTSSYPVIYLTPAEQTNNWQYSLITIDEVDTYFNNANLDYSSWEIRLTLDSTKAATTAALPTSTYNNAGGTITASANGVFPDQDGITLALNDRLLVRYETNGYQNGVYLLTTVGTVSTPWVLTRASDANTSAELSLNSVSVDSGTLFGGTIWEFPTITTLGTDNSKPIMVRTFSSQVKIPYSTISGPIQYIAPGNSIKLQKDLVPQTALNYQNAQIVLQRETSGGTTYAAGIGFHNLGTNGTFLYLDPTDLGLKHYTHSGSNRTILDSSNFTAGTDYQAPCNFPTNTPFSAFPLADTLYGTNNTSGFSDFPGSVGGAGLAYDRSPYTSTSCQGSYRLWTSQVVDTKDLYFNKLVDYNTGTPLWSGWQKIWTDLNDGTGSGLNADLLDGGDWQNPGIIGSNTKTAGYFTSLSSTALDSTSSLPTPFAINRTSTGQTNVNMSFSVNTGGTPTTRYFGINATGDLLVGTIADLNSSGSKIWHSGNDGTGSTLDADLLDGKDWTAPGSIGYTTPGLIKAGIQADAGAPNVLTLENTGNRAINRGVSLSFNIPNNPTSTIVEGARITAGAYLNTAHTGAYLSFLVQADGGASDGVVGEALRLNPDKSAVFSGTVTGTSLVNITDAIGTIRDLRFQSGITNRWVLRVDSSAEAGSNANTGSSFQLLSRADDGTAIDTVLSIPRIFGGTIAFNAARPVTTGPLSASGDFTTAAKTYHTQTYSVAVATYVPINLTSLTAILAVGNVYRIELATEATGTATGAVYIVYQTASSTWAIKQVSGNIVPSSNNPTLRINVAGTGLEVYHNHPSSAYTIQTIVTTTTTANATIISPTFFGLEGALSNLNGDITASGTVNTNGGLFLNRLGSTTTGIQFYRSDWTAWQMYMAPAVASQGIGGNLTAPSGTFVTSWGLRSFIENQAGYGWTWESGSSSSTTPAIVAELSSNTGTFRAVGAIQSDKGGSAFVLGPGATNDHCYMSFFARSATPATRSGFFGFGATSTTTLTLSNEISGGNINIYPTGTGSVYLTPNAYVASTGTLHCQSVDVVGSGFTSSIVNYTLTTTTITAGQIIASIPQATYRSADFIIQGVDATGAKFQITKILAIHNGSTTADYTEYGSTQINNQTGTFSVTADGTNMKLIVTPASTNSTVFKVTATLTAI